MQKAAPITHPSQITVSERVTFTHRQRQYFGYVRKKGRTYAYVIGDDNREYKIPYRLLTRIPGAPKQLVQGQSEKLRLQFQTSDRVEFVWKHQTRSGIITRLNPKRAHVMCDDEQEFQVPYERLIILQAARKSSAKTSGRDEQALHTIAEQARTLLRQHGLRQWSFQFDYGTKRAGSCQYTHATITMSYDYARHATDDEIHDTLCHEIAHALAGKEHHHDAVWRAKARELGGSGTRCHDRQFTPPRYIIKCANGCWVATAERRRRGIVCKQCHGRIQYLTYTPDRWEQELAQNYSGQS